MSRRVRITAVVPASAALVVTLLVLVVPSIRFAYFTPSGYVALHTSAGLIAALAAFIVLGRYRLTGSLADAGLVAALVIVAVTTLVFFTGPAVAARPLGALAIWGRAVGTLVAAVAFLFAAFVREHPGRRRRTMLRRLVVGYGVAALAGLTVMLAIAPSVDPPPGVSAASLAAPLVVGPPLLMAWHVAAACVFAAAAFGFVRRCREHDDGLTFALAASMPFAAAAELHSVLFASPYPSHIFAGNLFRLAFFIVVLIGLLHQIGSYQRVGERLGMQRERARLVQDLHDGPVQELALLRLLIDQLARRIADPEVSRLDERAAAALHEWRAAIGRTDEHGRPALAVRIASAARGAAADSAVQVDVRFDGDPSVPAGLEQDLIYLVREAVGNAVRHANASRIVVEVGGRPPTVLAVTDDGSGLAETDAAGGSGLGLTTMRERATALGLDLRIETSGAGTRISLEERARRVARMPLRVR